MTFGEFIRDRREKQNLSLRQMAQQMHISPSYLSDMERGNRKAPSKDLLDLIAYILKIWGWEKEKMYDMAAETSNDIPADIKEYLLNNKNKYDDFRKFFINK